MIPARRTEPEDKVLARVGEDHLSYFLGATALTQPMARKLLPSQRLVAAVLLDAVRTLRRQIRLRQPTEASERWFRSNGVHHPFTFCRICEALNLSSTDFRKRFFAQLTDYRKQLLKQGKISRRGLEKGAQLRASML